MYQIIVDFLKTNYFVIFYGITWVIAVSTFKKYFDTLLKYFPIFISFTFFIELLGSLILHYESFQLISGYETTGNNTFVIYNVYHLFYFPYFFYVYWNSINIESHKKTIKYGGSLFIIANIVNLFVQNPLIEPLVYAYLFGSILLIYCIIVYFKKIIRANSFLILKYNLLFWISLGLLIFHITYLPLKVLKEFWYDLYAPFRQLHLAMIVIMYLLFGIGFVVSKKRAFQ